MKHNSNINRENKNSTFLKKSGYYAGMVALTFAVSCSSGDREHRDNEVKDVDSTVSTTTKAQISTADVNMDGNEKSFITNAYLQSLYSRELAVVVQKSSNAELRTLAKSINADHTKLVEDLEKIAKGKGILLERELSDLQQKELAALKELGSPTLDLQFIQKIQGLQAASTVVYEEGSHLQNNDLNEYAANAMKVINAQQAATAKLVKTVQTHNSHGTRPGEVATQ